MRDNRVWAYAVTPNKNTATPTLAVGGRISNPNALTGALGKAAAQVRAQDWTAVDFDLREIDDERGRRRSNPPRDAMLELAFGDEATSDGAASDLARFLGDAMDQRSQPHLLAVVATHQEDEGAVAIWAFPQDDAFRFNPTKRPTIELLDRVFSRTSRLRKAARFEGQNHDSSFLRGNVVDFQTGRAREQVGPPIREPRRPPTTHLAGTSPRS